MDDVGTVRQNPETKAVALRTDLPNLPWFIGTVANGGHYDDGTECVDWPLMTGMTDATA